MGKIIYQNLVETNKTLVTFTIHFSPCCFVWLFSFVLDFAQTVFVYTNTITVLSTGFHGPKIRNNFKKCVHKIRSTVFLKVISYNLQMVNNKHKCDCELYTRSQITGRFIYNLWLTSQLINDSTSPELNVQNHDG